MDNTIENILTGRKGKIVKINTAQEQCFINIFEPTEEHPALPLKEREAMAEEIKKLLTVENDTNEE